MMRLYAVTDRAWVGEHTLAQQVEAALRGGITCLQLREKKLSDEELVTEAKAIKALCQHYGVPFIVNDNVAVALKCQADGIHVGQKDMRATDVRQLIGDKMILGVSAHTVEQAILAEKNGADYLGVGAMFATDTKQDAEAVSFETLKAICQAVSIPVCAIGGINQENLCSLQGTGVDGFAMVSAIFASQNIEQQCSRLRYLIDKVMDSHS